jgi:hypothetical protein
LKVNFIDPLYPACLFGYGHGGIPRTSEELLKCSKVCSQCRAVHYDSETRRKFCGVHEFGAVIVGEGVYKV